VRLAARLSFFCFATNTMKRVLWMLLIAFSILFLICLTHSIFQNAYSFGQASVGRVLFVMAWNGFARALEHVESPFGIIAIFVIACLSVPTKKK
jgi:hypothetical protein